MNANVERIRAMGMRVIRGKVPREVRNALNKAVKEELLGHLKKDGLKPEIYFHPDYYFEAIARQQREAEYAISNINKVFA